jgi:hypothetical protein
MKDMLGGSGGTSPLNSWVLHWPNIRESGRPVCAKCAVARQKKVLRARLAGLLAALLPHNLRTKWQGRQGRKCSSHLAGLLAALLPLHLGLQQRVVRVQRRLADARAQLGQAAPGVAAQRVEYLRAEGFSSGRARVLCLLTCTLKTCATTCMQESALHIDVRKSRSG